MSVYVDNANVSAVVWSGRRTIAAVWCHMTADSREELDAMADKVGLRRTWIQHPGSWQEHYDLTPGRRAAAVKAGAIEVDAFDHARHLAERQIGAAT